MKPNKARRCLADLKKNYENISHQLYYAGISKIYQYYDGNLPIKDIENFLSSNYVYTIHRQAKKPKVRNPVFVYYRRFQFQCDTIEISRIKKWNNNYSYILGAIDIWSRKAFCRLMFTKTAKETVEKMEEIFHEAGDLPETVLFDRGSELKNKEMTNFLKNLNIRVFYSDTSIHAPFIERWNYTIQSLIYKHMAKNNTFKFYDKLQDLCRVYNNRRHAFLKMSPNEAELPQNKVKISMLHEKKFLKVKKRKPKYKIGQQVRISKQKDKFSRGYSQQFQKELFFIVDIKQHLPIPLYVLQSAEKDEPIIEGKFYESEIFPASK